MFGHHKSLLGVTMPNISACYSESKQEFGIKIDSKLEIS